eukprot:CAMPEP_0201692234 /NCGR_PEP_ID=MMETSP0578-20130828/5189_1 /ASSEMBLY_ACC=CAM_ASM_000663 /TAXON_ID=267565 /ORGANISM="Skeletonema grethea, Strain CCMP 1804" /LENGTH=189 /DNA_ID=CAMNT_0048177585 /DNA_START=30 /DNA_END=599 /DNA_ORIENTATION=-
MTLNRATIRVLSVIFVIFLLPILSAAFISSERKINSWHHRRSVALRVTLPNWFGNKDDDSNIDETDLMQRTAKMMEDHRRSQEAMEKTSTMMDELAATLVVGESKKKGVKVIFNGQRRPVSVEVDPSLLISSSSGVISTTELNKAITEAMKNAYDQSGALMEKRMCGLYEQLGLPREPLSLDSKRDDQK